MPKKDMSYERSKNIKEMAKVVSLIYEDQDKSKLNSDNAFSSVNQENEKTAAEKEAKEKAQKREEIAIRRSAGFTGLIETFVSNYKEKFEQNKSLKKWFFITVMILFSVTLLMPVGIAICAAVGWLDGYEVIAMTLSSLGTIVASIIVIPKIIAQYLFSSKEDDAILDVLKEFYKNDELNRNQKEQ